MTMYGDLLTKLKLNLSNNVTVLTELSQGQVAIWRREIGLWMSKHLVHKLNFSPRYDPIYIQGKLNRFLKDKDWHCPVDDKMPEHFVSITNDYK